MNPMLTREPATPVVRAPGYLAAALVVVLGVGVIAGLLGVVRDPDTIDRVSIVNPTPYLLDIDVGAAGNPGRVALGIIEADATTTTPDVLDQGDRWVVRVSFAGHEVATVTRSRAELEDAGWRVTLPDSVAERVAGLGGEPLPT
jgi:hypothetical protein